MVEIRAFGTFEAWVGGGVADLGGRRQRAVLARLVAARGRMVPVERLIDDLWPGEAPAQALGGVQSFVSHLRRALEPGRAPRTPAAVLVTRPPGYALRLAEDAVDVWRFESLVARSADPKTAWRHAHAALELWRGPAYAEFADLSWAEAENARLTDLRLTAIERRAEAMVRSGAAALAVPDLEAHTAEHPLREEPWRLLALALYRTGRQADALAALRRIRSLLAEELGVDPGPALQTLERDILRQSPELDLAGPPVRLARTEQHAAESTAPPRALPAAVEDESSAEALVGRDRELAELLDAARGGRGLVLLSGEAGAGKTALADRACRELAAEGWAQAWGRTPEVDGAPAAWAWAELLRRLHTRHPAPPALAPMLDDDALPPDGDLAVARFKLHRAIGDYLAEAARRTPLVVVLEDLHRADEETLSLLAGLPGRVPGVTFIATYRPNPPSEPLIDVLGSLARHEPVRIELSGIDADAVAELVGRVCGTEVAPRTLAAIAERTAGNPFFVRETARLLDAEGPEAALREVPSGVGDVLRRRISRLPAAAQTVLRTAAVIGRDFDPELLPEVCGHEEETVLDALETALVTGLITENDGGTRFAHVLIRDALYGELSRLRRNRIHARVADALEERPHADPAALAHHHLAAGRRPDRAAHHARRAAEAAESRFAHHTAAQLWAQALDAHDRSGADDPRARLELVARLVRIRLLAGELMAARELLHGVLGELRALGDPELTARVVTAYNVPTAWSSHQYGVEDDPLVAIVRETLDVLPEGAARCGLLITLALELYNESTGVEEGFPAAAEAVEIARGLDDPGLLAHALNVLYCLAPQSPEAPREQAAIARELLDVAERHALGVHQVIGHMYLSRALATLLDLAGSRAHQVEAARLAHQYELPLLANISAWSEGMYLTVEGRFEEALEAYRRGTELLAATSMWGGEAAMLWIAVCAIEFARGRLAELEDDPPFGEELWESGPVGDLHTLVLLAKGNRERARKIFSRARPIQLDYLHEIHLCLRAYVGIGLADRAVAEDAYRRLLPYAGIYAGLNTASVALCPVAQVLGDLARFLGLDPRAHYARAAEVAEAVGSPHWKERALARLR